MQIAQTADVALLFIALPSFKESEGYDRADLDLTRQQVALIKAVTRVQKNTVVILNNGAPVAMSEWIDDTAAVLEAWMMGQAGGGAIADVLFGTGQPVRQAGRDLPAQAERHAGLSQLPRRERRSALRRGPVHRLSLLRCQAGAGAVPLWLWPQLHHLCLQQPQALGHRFKDVDGLTVSVDVTNTGPVAGKEIVQVYVHDRKSRLVRPAKELKGFAKVELQPGETKTVTVQLDFRAFAYYHPGYHRWITESGEFDILIGASSADIRCTATVTLQSTLELPSLLNPQSTVRDWLDDACGKPVFAPMFAQMTAQWGTMLGDDAESANGIGMDLTGFMMDMPLLNLLEFQENVLPTSASECETC